MNLDLTLLPDELAVCRLPAGAPLPQWASGPWGGLTSVTWTANETSVVCAASAVPPGVKAEAGWRAFVIAGPMQFTLTGVLVSVARPLADAGIGIFAVSTYDTDYVLVKQADLAAATAALSSAGHRIS